MCVESLKEKLAWAIDELFWVVNNTISLHMFYIHGITFAAPGY